jgi:hypothetical protein
VNLEANEVTINGMVYVPKSTVQANAEPVDGMPCVVIRTDSAGVFYGYLKSRNGKEVELVNAKRIWAWYGAASLSQLAVEGVKKPNDCKIPCAVPRIVLTEAIEIIGLSNAAFKSLESVPVWKA